MIGTSSTTVDGWTLDVTHGTAFGGTTNGDFHLFKCNGNDFWFGLKTSGTNLASIKTSLQGCGKARLDYGNCYDCFSCQNFDYVHVTLNGNEISKAANNGQELSKTIEFDFTNGDILELNEDGPSAIRINGLTILTCCAS